jgi:hypothetical protein
MAKGYSCTHKACLFPSSAVVVSKNR